MKCFESKLKYRKALKIGKVDISSDKLIVLISASKIRVIRRLILAVLTEALSQKGINIIVICLLTNLRIIVQMNTMI